MDIAVEPFDAQKVARARFVAISVPMHTALRLGVRVAARVRAVNPARAPLLLRPVRRAQRRLPASSTAPTTASAARRRRRCSRWPRRSSAATRGRCPPVGAAGRSPRAPLLRAPRLPGAEPRAACPPLEELRARSSTTAARPGRLRRGEPRLPAPAARTARSRRSTAAASSSCRAEIVLADIRQQVEAGRAHITFGDPDFLNGPGHALARRARAPRRVPRRDLRLHHQGRAPPAARARTCPSWPRSAACS